MTDLSKITQVIENNLLSKTSVDDVLDEICEFYEEKPSGDFSTGHNSFGEMKNLSQISSKDNLR